MNKSVFPELDSILLITGKIASGKTTLANLISQKLSFQYITISDFLKKDLNDSGIEINRTNLQYLGEKYYKEKSEVFFIRRTLELVKNNQRKIIIDGIRYPEGVKLLKDFYGIKCIIVFLDIESNIRQLRYNKNINRKEWIALDEAFTESKINDIKDFADIIFLKDEPPINIYNTFNLFLSKKYEFRNQNELIYPVVLSPIKVLCIGQLTEDHYYLVENIPLNNQFGNIIQEKITYGGNATNAAYCFAKLSCKAFLFSQTSQEFSIKYLKLLEADLISTDFIKINLDQHPKCFMYFNEYESVNFYQFSDIYKEYDFPLDSEYFDILFISADIDTTTFALNKIKKSNFSGLVCWAPGYETRFLTRNIINELIDYCNIIIVNEHEYDYLNLNGFIDQLNKEFKIVIKTKGNKGSELINNRFKVEWDALNIEIRNSFGAGDFFAAAFAFNFFRTSDEIDSLKFATQMTKFPLSSFTSRDNHDEF